MPNGQIMKISGGIKSLQPNCTGKAFSHGDHPYTCDNCFSQLRDLKNTMRHRKSGSLFTCKNRLGAKGFNKRYAKTGETTDAYAMEHEKRKSSEKTIKHLVRRIMSQREWEDCLHDACLSGDDEKLVVDMVRLMKTGISKTKPMQIMIIRNLVSKLRKCNNHHYIDRIKDISGLFKNELGATNYNLLADVFGLAGETTASTHSLQGKMQPGLNLDKINTAVEEFKGLPVCEGSDGARSLRYLQPHTTDNGEIVLVGNAWNPDCEVWHREVLSIPRKDPTKGDRDDFDALKRLVNRLLEKDKLAKTVSVHNLSCLTSLEKPTVINCMWPVEEKGYNHESLLKYWETLRKACYYDEPDKPRKHPLNLIGFSTDSAGFSLSAAKHLMTPSAAEIKEGVKYLGLGIEEERFLAPYYWFLPSIAYLDYDHEQRLFLKNLKYATRELTFWKDDGKVTRLATIEHLKDLRHRCEHSGLDCGFTATDLLLIYFCDQNSDACERMFTPQVADLLDSYVPGSQATSLYIRAVHFLIHPFRVPDFGSPEDVQKSVSCGITILRLWRRVIELQKLRLHSKRGAKSEPSQRGHFLTSGCYDTAEVLFSAATTHQLAMFLHFNELGTRWASPYNSGTKSTERIIGEMQGKTTEIQSLDSQPTFGDMLHKSTKVQYNINVKHGLALAGAKVTSSHKRKKLAFKYRKGKDVETTVYPDTYEEFKSCQIKAHEEGVNTAKALFEKYMPSKCIKKLKAAKKWDKPYIYEKPKGCKVVEKAPPKDFNKLDVSFATIDKDVGTSEQIEDDMENEMHEEEPNEDLTDVNTSEEVDFDTTDNDGENKTKWKISKMVNGKLTYVHIKQAIKILLPREYISRSRQKRHWARKHLPGKEPINEKHDIFKYCNVALRVTRNSKKTYQIARIEMIQSESDGKEVMSYEMKRSLSGLRLRCSIYSEEENDIYHIPETIALTNWRNASAVIGAVDLVPLPEKIGKYKLHPESLQSLRKLGYTDDGNPRNETDNNEDEEETAMAEDFYEVEDVIATRISKDTLATEYKVRFKGYGPEDDMWLPSSFFNRVLTFESTSRFGRKRKHKVDPENVQELSKKRTKKEPMDSTENNNKSIDRRKNKKVNKKSNAASSTTARKKETKQDKGRAFRSSLNTNNNFNKTDQRPDEIDVTSSHSSSEVGTVVDDIVRLDDNFKTPRRILAKAHLPEVDSRLTQYVICGKEQSVLDDPLQVSKVPPLSVLKEIAQKYRDDKIQEGFTVKFPLLGHFDKEGIRILERFHRIKMLKQEVTFEEKWIDETCNCIGQRRKDKVIHALLDRSNEKNEYLVSYNNYRITSQEYSLMCGERYLSDEIINLLLQNHCDNANSIHKQTKFMLLPSFLSTGEISGSLVEFSCRSITMDVVSKMFLPVHMFPSHWGLAVFHINQKKIYFDDGLHCAVPTDLKRNAQEILKKIHDKTGLQTFDPKQWSKPSHFVNPMPDQPGGSGSCGVAVICAARDIINGHTTTYTWSFKDMPRLRAELMDYILSIQ